MDGTQWFILAVSVVVITWTAIARPWLKLPTVSMALRDTAWEWSMLPFVAGFLTAHWFAPRNEVPTSAWFWMLPTLAVLCGWDLYWQCFKNGARRWFRYPLIYFVLGLPAGYLLWPQTGGPT